MPPLDKKHCIWPKMTYDIQQLIEKCMICQEYGKSQPHIGTTQELPPFPWHTLATDLFYWKRMDFLIVADVFSKYILVRKLPNSTSAAMCIELSMIVLELGLPHVIRSDNSPCYIPKSSNNSCNVTASHTRQSAQIIQDLMDLLREWLELLRSWWTKLEKKGNCGFQVCLTTGSHPSQAALHPHCIWWHSAHPGKRVYLNCPVHLVHQKCTKPIRNSSKGKGISLKGSTKNYSQLHYYGCNIG